ncbi:type VI secretion system Vgr family protein [Persicitalea jodogahamensis]|uniref:Gp5/Type VI secretion system Vgr protein OB-fold domain-containing protein n=1 Tax=Persicitalea jodogahamensis TaxID=402147 RepID=A0A8J3CZC6_9BACT|nr:phage baseplate assembly protein V [Persicitalea jodogahamensis]GHB52120.1 hypothetical protein GCM10007390_00930 [Persicitalea jodogahamensis]
MAKQVNIKIELEGGNEISRHLGLVIEQRLFDHHRFELLVPFDQLETSGEHFFNQSHRNALGRKITFTFSPRREGDEFEYVFQGIVTEIRLRSLSDMSSAFVLKGASPTILLEDSPQRRSFIRGSVQELFDQVLRPYPQNLLRRNLNPNNGGRQIPFIQYKESNYRFLCRVADRCAEWFYYDGRELVLGPGNSPETDFRVDGTQNFDLAMVMQPARFAMFGYDYTEHQTFTGESSAQDVEGLTTLSEFALQQSDELFAAGALLTAPETVGSQQEADELARMRRSALTSSMVDFRGQGENPDLSVGTILNVKGDRINDRGERYEESFGKYRVTEITHRVNTAGSYQNDFRAVPESARHPPANPSVTNPLGENELAEVIDNGDPESLGRVRVRFDWGQPQSEDQESYWIRVGTFHSSEGRGANFIPELGAQVLVGYEQNLAENPVVLTSLYRKPDDDTDYSPPDNDLKVIATRSGNMIIFSDKAGEAQIQISNREQTETHILLDFSDDGRIKINVGNGLVEVNSRNIKMSASENIELKARQNITLEAGSIEANADQNITLKANANLEMEGTAAAKMKGGQVEISGDATTEVKSSGVAILKGSLVQIN